MNKRHRISILSVILPMTALILLFLAPKMQIHAGNGTLMDVTSSTELKSAASDDSTTVKTLNKGDMVFVMGNEGNGWYKVYYQGNYYYIRNNKVRASQLVGNTDPNLVLGSGYQNEIVEDESSEEAKEPEEEVVTESIADSESSETFSQENDTLMIIDEDLQAQLEEEFDQASEDFDKEVERMHKAKIQSIVWKIIVAVIVIAMFAVGIVTTLKQQKKKDETDNSDPML